MRKMMREQFRHGLAALYNQYGRFASITDRTPWCLWKSTSNADLLNLDPLVPTQVSGSDQGQTTFQTLHTGNLMGIEHTSTLSVTCQINRLSFYNCPQLVKHFQKRAVPGMSIVERRGVLGGGLGTITNRFPADIFRFFRFRSIFSKFTGFQRISFDFLSIPTRLLSVVTQKNSGNPLETSKFWGNRGKTGKRNISAGNRLVIVPNPPPK